MPSPRTKRQAGGRRTRDTDALRSSTEEASYGDCAGCDNWNFLVGGLCLSCRTVAKEQEDPRPEDQKRCLCERNAGGRVIDINGQCPQHGTEW